MVIGADNLILREAADGRVKIKGLTVEQYDCLIEQGWLSEDPKTELVEGFIVQKDRSHQGEDPKTVGSLHAWVIAQLVKLATEVQTGVGSLRIQSPIRIPPSHDLSRMR